MLGSIYVYVYTNCPYINDHVPNFENTVLNINKFFFQMKMFILQNRKYLDFYWNVIQLKRILLGIIYYRILQYWNFVTKNKIFPKSFF